MLFKYTVLICFRLEIFELDHFLEGFISRLFIDAIARTAQGFATFASSEQPLADTLNCGGREQTQTHTNTAEHTIYMSVLQPKVFSLPNTCAPATMATDHKLVTCHNQLH
jgi:hypothetical protein